MKNFHCCASCIHYEVKKVSGQCSFRCRRLGFETRPTYQFTCWTPKEAVKKLMEKEEKHEHG